MKKLLVTAAALLTLSAPAFGAGLDLAWDACVGDGGASDLVPACANPSAVNKLLASYFSDVSLTTFAAGDFVVDLQADDAGLPAFWTFQTPISAGSCNFAVLDDGRALAECTAATTWGAGPFPPPGGQADVSLGYVPNIGGAANRGRFVGSIFRTTGTTVNAGTDYYLFDMEIYTGASAAGLCAGCDIPVAIVLNQLTLLSLGSETLEADPVVIDGPGRVSNCATTHGGGTGDPCGATPTQKSSWGALKSLYR